MYPLSLQASTPVLADMSVVFHFAIFISYLRKMNPLNPKKTMRGWRLQSAFLGGLDYRGLQCRPPGRSPPRRGQGVGRSRGKGKLRRTKSPEAREWLRATVRLKPPAPSASWAESTREAAATGRTGFEVSKTERCATLRKNVQWLSHREVDIIRPWRAISAGCLTKRQPQGSLSVRPSVQNDTRSKILTICADE